MGIDPIHFAIVVIVNLTLGMVSPPVGGLLFVTAMVAKVSQSALNREIYPMLALQIVVLLLLTFVPQFSTWLPQVMSDR